MLTQQLQKIKLQTVAKKYLADTITPVSIYLKIRDHFDSSLLLESTDFRSVENCYSFICMNPIASFEVSNKTIQTLSVNGETQKEAVENFSEVPFKMNQFMEQFEVDTPENYKGVNGFFGYMSFEAVQFFDTQSFDLEKRKTDIPELNYKLFRFIIAVNHFNDELYILENIPPDQDSQISKIETLIKNRSGELALDEAGPLLTFSQSCRKLF